MPILKKMNWTKGEFKNMNNLTGMTLDLTTKFGVPFALGKLKNHFGKEFLFQDNNGRLYVRTVVNGFIKKYDTSFDKHSQTSLDINTSKLVNQFFIIKIDLQTYIMVATGSKIPNLESMFLASDELSTEDLWLYIFGKHSRKYIKELEKLVYDATANTSMGIYSIDADMNRECDSTRIVFSPMSSRNMDTLIYSDGESEEVSRHLDQFLAREKFYQEKQLLYKTGIMLYGDPGTGKSSLVKAIASKYGRNIVSINMENIEKIDLASVTKSINVDNNKYIVLLEDIDTVFKDRSGSESSQHDKCINKLLQFLDSNTSPHNVIFIATTNYYDHIDAAILRDGRFDLKVEVKPLSVSDIPRFCKAFDLNDNQIHNVELATKDKIANGTINQSALQNIILKEM